MAGQPLCGLILGGITCLTKTKSDAMFLQVHSNMGAMVNDLIHTGEWRLPSPDPRLRHLHPNLIKWLSNIDRPPIDLSKPDHISWGEWSLKRLKVWHI